jgi:hypothetical protein
MVNWFANQRHDSFNRLGDIPLKCSSIRLNESIQQDRNPDLHKITLTTEQEQEEDEELRNVLLPESDEGPSKIFSP